MTACEVVNLVDGVLESTAPDAEKLAAINALFDKLDDSPSAEEVEWAAWGERQRVALFEAAARQRRWAEAARTAK